MFYPDLVADLIEQFRRSGFRCDFSVHNIALFCRVVKNKQGFRLEIQLNSTLYRRRIYTDFGVNITLGKSHKEAILKTVAKIICVLLLTLSTPSFADCTYNAKDKSKFTVLDSHTIILQGGPGPDIIIKTYSFINRASSITVLKDSFCSYESAVLYIDGEVADANQVTKVQ